ncbi:MAG: adenylate/guanylate cyclase domain-containing protein [Alphaproteobacteria bacterium]
MERRLAAIFAADVVGYSRLIRTDEEGTLAAFQALRSELVDPKIDAHRGRIVKTTGDGLLVEFASVVDAVRAAGELQKAIGERNANLPEAKRIIFRVGINLGDVVIDGDDIHGDGVNVAARLEALAEPGGICVSGTVHDQVRDRLDFAFEDMGEQQVKNIDRPVRVWRWSPATTADNRTDTTSVLDTHDNPSIAVLPFDNMSGDPEQEFFADGMTEDVITLLSTVPELFVIARNSTFAYKDQSPDVRKVAEELGVRYVLEGSVRKAGNRIRVTAQFIDALTGNHIWADRYDRELEDIFAVQDEVAEGIAGALQSRLLIAESDYMSRKPPETLDAWGNVVRARIKMFAYRPQDMDEAEPLARRALEIQSDYAPAHAVLGQILAWRSYNGWSDDWLGSAREAIKHAQTALEIDANNPAVLMDAAFSYIWLGLFWKAAPVAERAVELNPNSALCCSICGHALAVVGRAEEGVKLTAKAFVLSPKDPLEYMFHLYEGSAHYFAGDLKSSQRAVEHALRLKPDLMFGRLILAAILTREGEVDAARRELARVVQFGSEDAIRNIFRPRTSGTRWRDFTDPIREIYDGPLPEQPD